MSEDTVPRSPSLSAFPRRAGEPPLTGLDEAIGESSRTGSLSPASPASLAGQDRTARGRLRPRQLFRSFRVLLPFIAVIAVWWGIKAGADVSDRLLVAPPAVWSSFVYLLDHGILAEYASSSLRMIGLAALISFGIGVPLGFAVGTNRYAARALEGTLRFFQGISGIAWLPLAILWFGFTHTTTLTIVIYTLIVPIIFNTMTGVRAIPENYVLALQSLGASRLRIVRDVYLPGALPSIMVGTRLGMGYGWRALIASEMLVRQGGLGDLIFGARTFNQIDRIMVGMVVIGTLYIVVDRLLVQPVEAMTLARWGILRT
jgi:taurine transport system permease protein